MTIKSVLQSAKNLFRRGEDAGPSLVSDIVAETQKKIELAGTDLRSLQTRLHLQARQHRKDHATRAELAAHQLSLFRRRPRRRQAAAKVLQSGVYYGGDMVMLMDNGQLLNPAKPHRNPVLRNLITQTMLHDIAEAGKSK